MFCPNCGNKVDPNDNYCKICGKNLKNVKVKIVSENNNQIDTNSDSKDKTIVFKSIKNIDSIENTRELKEIIKQVDETVKSNIENYTKASEKTLAEEKRLREEIDKKLKASEEEKKKSEKVEKESKEKKDSEIKKDSEPKKDAESKKKSKSFKEKFRDFINEEDEFSIFEKSPNPQDINMTLTDMEPVNIENTMSIPKAEIEARLKETEKTEEKDLSKAKEPAKIESKLETKVESKDEKKKSKPENLDKKEIEDKDNKKDSKESTKTTTDEKSKDVDPKHISSKDFYDEVNRALKENPEAYLEEEKKSIFSFFKSKKSDKKDKIDSKEKERKEEKSKAPKKENKPKDEAVSNKSETLENIDDKAKGFIFKLEKRLNFNDKTLRNGVIGIVYLLNVLAVMLAVRKLSIAIFVLPLLRILLTLAEHYYPLDIATNKVSFITDQDEVNQKSFVNWALCQVLVFILYIINPIGGMFNFTILESITPGIVSTIILFLVTTFIATSLYKDRIEEDKIDFIGWYLVPFILFEMLMKILFLLVDFLTKSFLI